jgi:hypothetical protein
MAVHWFVLAFSFCWFELVPSAPKDGLLFKGLGPADGLASRMSAGASREP